jgi:hypothetical protein
MTHDPAPHVAVQGVMTRSAGGKEVAVLADLLSFFS